jgi:hypothetical protein
VAPAIPITKLKLDTNPSFPPRTAARKALPPTDRWRFSNRARVDAVMVCVLLNIFFKMVTCAVSEREIGEFVFLRAFKTDEEILLKYIKMSQMF